MSSSGKKPPLHGARKVYGDECVAPGLITPKGKIYSGTEMRGMGRQDVGRKRGKHRPG